MYVNSTCDDLFVDNNDTLYCSMFDDNQVVKRSLNDPVDTSPHVVAGTGVTGTASYEFHGPSGLFVDTNLDLYVADYENHRVQLFQYGESNGTTVAGLQSLNPTISLIYPTVINLDAEKYLFIMDYFQERIVGSGSYGFRCLVGCHGEEPESYSLARNSFYFDRSGNMFVAGRIKIQKFQYLEESCKKIEKKSVGRR
ncbi:unnamed protein product [Adineta steineri]|uniref:Uncharacterized protein n=2 Tax=Adineta steineri TaxID=433720 RepID=A0A815LJ99_9BILA|nr:unnamed protein product [Adineta steineri]